MVLSEVVKQRFARLVNQQMRKSSAAPTALPDAALTPVWQKRFYDFNVSSTRKRIEKLRYMHRNPVRRGLLAKPDQWKWSSFRSYAYGEVGPVSINCQEWLLQLKYHAGADASGGPRK